MYRYNNNTSYSYAYTNELYTVYSTGYLYNNIIGRIDARACAFAKSVNQPLTSAGVYAEERRR